MSPNKLKCFPAGKTALPNEKVNAREDTIHRNSCFLGGDTNSFGRPSVKGRVLSAILANFFPKKVKNENRVLRGMCVAKK